METSTSSTEEMGNLISHAILLLDGSGSMVDPELRTRKPKHEAVAEMVQDLIGILYDDDEIVDTLLTVICYDGNRINDVRLLEYDVKGEQTHYREKPYKPEDLKKWDPLSGPRRVTPIGRALAYAREVAEAWVMSAPGGKIYRTVICLLSDGMNYPDTEPNGVSERAKIVEFTTSQEEKRKQGADYKGRIRIATIGYYQYPEEHRSENPSEEILGEMKKEAEGRALLKKLAYPEESAYFESADAQNIARFIRLTILAQGQGLEG